MRPKRKPRLGERLRAILRKLPADSAFMRPEQPSLERGARWSATQGLEPPTPRKRKSKR